MKLQKMFFKKVREIVKIVKIKVCRKMRNVAKIKIFLKKCGNLQKKKTQKSTEYYKDCKNQSLSKNAGNFKSQNIPKKKARKIARIQICQIKKMREIQFSRFFSEMPSSVQKYDKVK